ARDVEQQGIQLLGLPVDGGAGGARRIQGGEDVLGGRTVGVGEALQGAEVGPDRLRPWVQLPQNLIESSSSLADALALSPYALSERGQDGVELGRIDLVEQTHQVLEHCV